ncbi:MAG: hypothetical protein HFI75_15400 [Lachnospiraceae bacterium]|nr:hypothetical protein [Lachnospiraceae bacterium]
MLHKSRDDPLKKPRFLNYYERQFIKGSELAKVYQFNSNSFSSYLQGENGLQELNPEQRLTILKSGL